MSLAVWFVVLSLASWRITSLLVNEGGPFDIFARFRGFIGVYYDEYSNVHGKNVFAKAFTCVWCLGFWISLMICTLLMSYVTWWQFPFVVLAMNAVIIVIEGIK